MAILSLHSGLEQLSRKASHPCAEISFMLQWCSVLNYPLKVQESYNNWSFLRASYVSLVSNMHIT